MEAETRFFQQISDEVLRLVQEFSNTPAITTQKGLPGDYATEVDVAVEHRIVEYIRAHFPTDAVLAEESYSETQIGAGRIWIIDPICGTRNLGRGIRNFCTNIALAIDGELAAACVIDHACGDYIWTVGTGIMLNKDPVDPPHPDGVMLIDIDMDSVAKAEASLQTRYIAGFNTLIRDPALKLVSLDSTLGFAYTATGKMDGFINLFTYPWDICASAYLVQQASGTITDFAGNPWQIGSQGAIAARDAATHQKLLRAFNA